MKKGKYEPHPKLGTKVVPSGKDYDRDENRKAIEAEQREFAERGMFGGDTGIDADFYDPTNDMESEAFFNAEGDRTTAEEMYEHGFHIEMPEN